TVVPHLPRIAATAPRATPSLASFTWWARRTGSPAHRAGGPADGGVPKRRLQYLRMVFSDKRMLDSQSPIALADYRAELNAWLDAHRAELAPPFAPPGTLDEHVVQMQRVKSILFEAGWMQCGWPERVGGRGGSPVLATGGGGACGGAAPVVPGG